MPQDPILSAAQREKHPGLPLYSLHLDLIRGLAAFLVFVGHLRLIVTGHTGNVTNGETPGLLTHPVHATGFGHTAVVVFFVLSGYLVGGTVVRDLARGSFSWVKYAFRRLSRLWTVLIPTLMIGFFIDAISTHCFATTRVVSQGLFTEGFHTPGIGIFLQYISFLQSIARLNIITYGTNVALWSLSNEFWYYLLFPMLAVALFGKRTGWLARVALLLVAGFLLWFVGTRISGYFLLWLCGVLAYIVPAKIPTRFQSAATIVLALQFIVVLVSMRFIPTEGFTTDALISFSFTLMLYAILHQVGPASASLYSRFAHFISFPSYSLYATHVPVCILFAAGCEAFFPSLFRHAGLATAAVGASVLVYSGIFYLIFERNTDRIRRFAEAHLLRQPATPHPS